MLNQSFRGINLAEKALDGTWLRHEALSNNLANVNTPGYKREDVNFDEVLQNYLNQDGTKLYRTNDKHLPVGGHSIESLTPTIDKTTHTSYRKDGNNVNVDIEMAELAKNQLRYNALAEQINGQMARIRLAIRNGR